MKGKKIHEESLDGINNCNISRKYVCQGKRDMLKHEADLRQKDKSRRQSRTKGNKLFHEILTA